VFFLFPMVTYTANLPFSPGKESLSMLGVILAVVDGLDIGSMINLIFLERSGGAFLVMYLALVMVLLGIVAGVLNFFVLLLSGFGYHAKGNVALCSLSIVFFVAAIIMVLVSSSMFKSTIPEIFSLDLSYSLFIGIFFFAVNLTLNCITEKQFKPLRKEMAEQELADIIKAQKELNLV